MSRSIILSTVALGLLSFGSPAIAQSPSQAPAQGTSIVGVWTLNKELSDQRVTEARPGEPDDREHGDRGRSGGHGGSGGGFGGGFGGGGFGGGGRGGGGRGNAEDMQRRFEAMRAVMDAPERMTITRTESMVIITAQDGRTTRLATDNSKVKDESTGIQRRTRWDGDRLVNEITGAGRGKVIETYAVDPDSRRLVVSVQRENEKDGDGGPRRRVYDPQQP